jgi:hypothetical protein
MNTATELKHDTESPLQSAVAEWLIEKGEEYGSGWEGAWEDLERGGGESGIVSGLIYYKDTTAFFDTHKQEILELLKNTLKETGYDSPAQIFGDKWDNSDPLAFDQYNKNLLAWFAWEETARIIALGNGAE